MEIREVKAPKSKSIQIPDDIRQTLTADDHRKPSEVGRVPVQAPLGDLDVAIPSKGGKPSRTKTKELEVKVGWADLLSK